jgi:hypothetical protein
VDGGVAGGAAEEGEEVGEVAAPVDEVSAAPGEGAEAEEKGGGGEEVGAGEEVGEDEGVEEAGVEERCEGAEAARGGRGLGGGRALRAHHRCVESCGGAPVRRGLRQEELARL